MKIMHHKDISIIAEYLLSTHLLFLAPGLDYLGSQHQPWGVLHALVHLSKTATSGTKADSTEIRLPFPNSARVFEVWNVSKTVLRVQETVMTDCNQISM